VFCVLSLRLGVCAVGGIVLLQYLGFSSIGLLSARNTFQIFLLGAVAKLGATVVTYPLLVVKVIAHVSGFFILNLVSALSSFFFLWSDI